MRIAYVCADLGVPVFGRKGCSIHVQEVVRTLVHLGHQVELFTPRPEGPRPSGLECVPVHALPPVVSREAAAREQAALAANASLRRSLEAAGPFDAIYERYSLWSFAGMEYARTAAVPGVLEVNAPLIEEQADHRTLMDRFGAEEVARRVFGDAATLIAVSEEVAEYLRGYPAADGRVLVVPNGVDTERFRPGLKPLLPRDDATFTVGFVGSLKPWHGLSVLVAAFALLHQRHPDSRLIVVGEGPERRQLALDLSDRGLSGAFHLTGAIPSEDVPRMLASFDAAAAPYIQRDGFYFSPLKVYEYMAAGLPVAASDVGQLTQLIQHGINGLLCPPGDASALAAALENVCVDAALRRRLGEAARRTVLDDHTWTAAVRRILALARPFSSVSPSTGERESP
jgi:glycosyltransferase involved in cell wall biosynthesis